MLLKLELMIWPGQLAVQTLTQWNTFGTLLGDV